MEQEILFVVTCLFQNARIVHLDCWSGRIIDSYISRIYMTRSLHYCLCVYCVFVFVLFLPLRLLC